MTPATGTPALPRGEDDLEALRGPLLQLDATLGSDPTAPAPCAVGNFAMAEVSNRASRGTTAR